MSDNFFELLQAPEPLKIVGTINAYSALLAKKNGHKAIYLSGAGVANAPSHRLRPEDFSSSG